MNRSRITLSASRTWHIARALPFFPLLNRLAPVERAHYVARPLRLKSVSVAGLIAIIIASPVIGFAKPRVRTERLAIQYSLYQDPGDLEGKAIRLKLSRLLFRPAIRLFLAVIQKAEGGEPNLMVGGCRAKNLKAHPALTLPMSCRYRIRIAGRLMLSTASGNYQITLSNWQRIATFLGLTNFSETSQALAALELIRRGGGAADAFTAIGRATKRRIQQGFLDLLNDRVNRALCSATYDWASSSCSPLPAAEKIDYAKLAKTLQRSQSVIRRRPDARPYG